MYALLALIAAIENVFPPVPADTAVALGAFLSHRGVTTPWLVFVVTIVANSLSLIGVYAMARRLGPAFTATRWGRRLLPPELVAVVEREYLRWGLPAIFLCRLMPGVRAIVPPFTGLIGLSPRRALVPTIAASALWYAGVTVVGAVVGAEWGAIVGLIQTVNRALAIAGVVLGALALALVWRRFRRRRPAAAVRTVDTVLGKVLPPGTTDDR